MVLVDGRPVLVKVAFAVQLAILRVLGVGRILQQFDDLLGGQVVRNVAYLPLEWLDVALASADHLLLLHLHEKLLSLLLRELVELALALCFLLLGWHLGDGPFCSFALHALPVALRSVRRLAVPRVKLVGDAWVCGDARLLLRQELVVLCLLGQELSLNVVGLRGLLHLIELVRQGFPGLVWL